MKKIFFLLLAATAMLSCKHLESMNEAPAGSFNLDSVKAAINADNKNLMAAVKKGDSAAILTSYTKDACMMPGNMPNACGQKEMSAFFGGLHKMGIENLKLMTTEVLGSSELVSEEGRYEITANDGAMMEKGKFLVLWKKEDGKWKKYRDMFSSDAPPPPPAPAKK